MKKALLLSIIVLLVGVSGTAFAATVGYAPDSLTLGTSGDLELTLKLSKSVMMRVDLSAAVAPAIVNNYVMGAYHNSGSRTFGTSNLDQKLWYRDGTGLTPPGVGTTTTAPDFTGASWLAL